MAGQLAGGNPRKKDNDFAVEVVKDGYQAETLSGNLDLGSAANLWAYPSRLAFDPGGANRTITLPAEAVSDGLRFWIRNSSDGGETLTVQDDTPATVAVVYEGETCLFECNGTSWRLVERRSSGAFAANGGHNVETLAGTKTLVVSDATFQHLDPDGSNRDVNLPAEASSRGLAFRILNTANAGSEDLVVKDDGGSTIVTISQNEAAWVVCNGTSWVHSGIESIALS